MHGDVPRTRMAHPTKCPGLLGSRWDIGPDQRAWHGKSALAGALGRATGELRVTKASGPRLTEDD